MNDNRMSKNLQYTRRRLRLSQRQFVDNFITDEKGNPLLSVPKLSNLENKGGNNLDMVCRTVADRLGMELKDFSLEHPRFITRLEESLQDSGQGDDKYLEDIVSEAGQQSELSAFIRKFSNHLTDRLLSGDLMPGDRIDSERSISAQFGVSRSIARETLKVMNVLGMIDIIPGKGTFMANGGSDFFTTPISWAIYLGDKNTNDVFFVRRALEESTISMACREASSQDLRELENILKKTCRAMDKEDYRIFSELDIEFHMRIAACSGNQVVVNLLGVLRQLSRSISQKGMINMQQLRDIYREHRGLLEAIKKKDPVKAREMLLEHFGRTRERYEGN